MMDLSSIGLTGFQWILLLFLILGCSQYMWLIWEEKYSGYGMMEGFTDSDNSRTSWYENDELYDDFYASVYDNLTQLAGRYPQEIALIMHQWKKEAAPDTMDVLDCACGTGIASIYFAKQGVNSVVGLDKSEAMLRRARNVTLVAGIPTLKDQSTVKFLQGDMQQQVTFKAGQFSHAVLLFFTIYYSNDMVGLFNNLFFWIRPGGYIAVEVVNKYKFDPLLESATPFVGLSLQRYSKTRVTKSKVVFDKFTYEAEFDLQDPQAEFRETFRFKDKSTRRQRHTMTMRDIKDIVELAQTAGWNYTGNIDLVSAGFEYAYVLLFSKS